MTLNPDFQIRFQMRGLFARRVLRDVPSVKSTNDERAAICARRELLNRLICENAGAVEGEHGM